MLRMVAKISMSSVLLATQRTNTIGPVTSVSSASGSLANDTPIEGRLPASAVEVQDALATPALVIPLAEYESELALRGASMTSAPGTASSPPRAAGRRKNLVQRVRLIGHSFSKRHSELPCPPLRMSSFTGVSRLMPYRK